MYSERLSSGNELYVFALQGKQVLYVVDHRNSKQIIVMPISSRDLYNMSEVVINDDYALQTPNNSNIGDVGTFCVLVIKNWTRCDFMVRIVQNVSTSRSIVNTMQTDQHVVIPVVVICLSVMTMKKTQYWKQLVIRTCGSRYMCSIFDYSYVYISVYVCLT